MNLNDDDKHTRGTDTHTRNTWETQKKPTRNAQETYRKHTSNTLETHETHMRHTHT